MRTRIIVAALFAGIAGLGAAQVNGPEVTADHTLIDDRAAERFFVSIFNGKDLTGWDGNPNGTLCFPSQPASLTAAIAGVSTPASRRETAVNPSRNCGRRHSHRRSRSLSTGLGWLFQVYQVSMAVAPRALTNRPNASRTKAATSTFKRMGFLRRVQLPAILPRVRH